MTEKGILYLAQSSSEECGKQVALLVVQFPSVKPNNHQRQTQLLLTWCPWVRERENGTPLSF
jgi:hypothetical protein